MHKGILFTINPNTGTPVFKQLVDQTQRLIARGQLKEGDLLPSTRELAKLLTINPMTVSKAYSQLETMHLVTRKKGIGMLVNSATEFGQTQQQLIQPALIETCLQGKQLGLSLQEIKALLSKQWRTME